MKPEDIARYNKMLYMREYRKKMKEKMIYKLHENRETFSALVEFSIRAISE